MCRQRCKRFGVTLMTDCSSPKRTGAWCPACEGLGHLLVGPLLRSAQARTGSSIPDDRFVLSASEDVEDAPRTVSSLSAIGAPQPALVLASLHESLSSRKPSRTAHDPTPVPFFRGSDQG